MYLYMDSIPIEKLYKSCDVREIYSQPVCVCVCVCVYVYYSIYACNVYH